MVSGIFRSWLFDNTVSRHDPRPPVLPVAAFLIFFRDHIEPGKGAVCGDKSLDELPVFQQEPMAIVIYVFFHEGIDNDFHGAGPESLPDTLLYGFKWLL